MTDDAVELFRAGRLDESLAKLQSVVRADPSSPTSRLFLAQLLMVLGQWERASKQLEVLRSMGPVYLPMVQTYQTAIDCERHRLRVFAGEHSPLLFGEPPSWVAGLVQALTADARNEPAEAAALRSAAMDSAPAISGILNGRPFQWLADADPRLGPTFEVLLNGRYYWVPVQRIRRVVLEPPADVRDLVWMPAQFVWANGGEAVGLIPTRYPRTESSDDATLRMARRTIWQPAGGDSHVGLGQRMLTTDGEEIGLLDVRELSFADEGSDGSTQSA